MLVDRLSLRVFRLSKSPTLKSIVSKSSPLSLSPEAITHTHTSIRVMKTSRKERATLVSTIQYTPIALLCLTLLAAAAANFLPVECLSMPINQQQQHPQQILPSITPKIPMISFSKPQQQQPQQQQHQRKDFRQAPNFVASPMNLSEPVAAKSLGADQTSASLQLGQTRASSSGHQRPELYQTSASYLTNEISAPPATRQLRQRAIASQLQEQQSRVSAQSVAEGDDSDSDSNDEADNEDEPAAAAAELGSLRPRDYNQKAQAAIEMGLAPAAAAAAPRRSSSGNRLEAQDQRATVEAVTRRRYNGPHVSDRNQAEGEEDSASRREQENAEASEAEVADRSALDEQRQQQRQIILAQAQSEAKAIKEQQESLLKQQALQQQMIMRRQHELDNHNRSSNSHPMYGGHSGNRGALSSSSADRRSNQQQKPSTTINQSTKRQRAQRQQNFADDQADDRAARYPGLVSKSSIQDEDTDYSIRRPLAVIARQDSIPSGGSIPKYGVNDLLPAAQHSYGAHYAPLHGYQKDYYQFAESFKKGQFHSGFKRGGNKFQISGHASQHKSHAEGHVKWNGYKGKGVSYWNYQHGDNKKHYGSPGGEYYH